MAAIVEFVLALGTLGTYQIIRCFFLISWATSGTRYRMKTKQKTQHRKTKI
jgi:hypothetical protein